MRQCVLEFIALPCKLHPLNGDDGGSSGVTKGRSRVRDKTEKPKSDFNWD